MTDFKGFDPNRKIRANFNPNRQGKGQQSDSAAENPENQPGGDPYADLKMDPSRMLSLLAAQGQSNKLQLNVSANNIEKSVDAFSNTISPERHSLVSRMLEHTYQNEFGKKPSAETLQNIVDDYLIGQVTVQSS